MKKYLFFLLLGSLAVLTVQAQTPCTNTNFPAPPGDSLEIAPFFCGNYLDAYCGSTFNLNNNTPPPGYDTLGLHDGWIRLSTCGDSLSLGLQVANCLNGAGLHFSLAEMTSGGLQVLQNILVDVPNNGSAQLNVPGLQADTTYFLWINGISGDQCSFEISVLEGIGTADPTPGDCQCSGSNIDGPTTLCAGDAAVFTFNPGSCTITPGIPSGGNGYVCNPPGVCPPPPANTDGWVPVWHSNSPSVHFLPDSVGFQVTMVTDTALQLVDTVLQLQIWVTLEDTSSTNNPGQDSLTFCDCTTTACGIGGAVLDVTIENHLEFYFFTLNCYAPTASLDGFLFDTPGVFSYSKDPCTQVTVTINADFVPPLAFPVQEVICAGQSVTLAPFVLEPFVLYFWSTGETSPSITVTTPVSTAYGLVLINPVNGCTAEIQNTVVVTPVNTIDLGTITICAGQSYTQCGFSVSTPGNYSLSCPNGMLCPDNIEFTLVVTPKEVVPLGIQGVITCNTPCVTVLGQNYCQAGQYSTEDTCHIYTFEIVEDLALPQVSALTEDCLPDNSAYTVGFSISGSGPFQVNGAQIAGNYYVSPPQLNGNAYVFVVKGNNGCITVVNGSFDCSAMCSNDPGALGQSVLSVCADATAQLEVTAVASPAGDEIVEYWLLDAGGNPLLRQSGAAFTFDPVLLQTGIPYRVVQVVGPIDATGHVDMAAPCTQFSAPQTLVFQAPPVSADLEVVQPDCQDKQGTIEVQEVVGGQAPFDYSIDNQSFGSSAVFDALLPGAYQIRIRDQYGCMLLLTAEIQPVAPLQLVLPADISAAPGEALSIVALSNHAPVGVQWMANPGGLLPDQDLTLETVARQNTLFTLLVTDAAGCSATASLLLTIGDIPGIYRPNVLDANAGTEENRFFTLYSQGQYIEEIESLTVFDRWGEMVWQRQHLAPNQPEKGWDGTRKGRKSLPGVYVYVAELRLFDGSKLTFRGDITVL
jgi:hypothetical protein